MWLPKVTWENEREEKATHESSTHYKAGERHEI